MRSSTLSATLDHVPVPIRVFVARRVAEALGVLILCLSAASTLALVTWSVRDPSLNHATSGPTRNLLGYKGAIVADLTMQLVGIAAVALLTPPIVWSWRLIRRRRLDSVRLRLILWMCGTLCAAGLASLLPVTDRWPLPTGLGGVLGDALLSLPHRIIGGSHIAVAIAAGALVVGMILCIAGAIRPGVQSSGDFDEEEDAALRETRSDDDAAGEPGFFLIVLGAVIHGVLSARAALRRGFIHARRQWSKHSVSGRPLSNCELPIPLAAERREPSFEAPTFDPSLYAPRSVREAAETGPRTSPAVMPARRTTRESARKRGSYQLPSLQLLSEAKKIVATKISEDALEQNARLLEGVLDDFGVKGEIIHVRPGPVVTLYELEPAPGIKSSRVIGLADDIARSMSAVSARVAVVQGRNAIGIELPNQRRETVYLRELLGSQDFEKSKHRLAIALGKTIGGEPVIVDLASMPHLLVAGTTGSGKSVAINTMILSLLYRLKPEECRLIMIDPKMLELSVYDGIPHLLTPVVTDPKKAVVALKWAVREMEDRYKQMSKLGVRNIDGFNARVAEASAKGETLTRTVQTGYDRETGEAIYEQEEMELSVLPYIVVDRRRDGRPDDGRRQGHRRRDPAPCADGARRRHSPDHGDAAPVGRCHHRHDQGEFPDPHLLPGDLQDRQPHHPRRAGRRAAAWARATCCTWRAAGASRACMGLSSSDSEVEKVVAHLKTPGPAGISRRDHRGGRGAGMPRATTARAGRWTARKRATSTTAPSLSFCATANARRATSSAASRSATTRRPRSSSGWRRRASSRRQPLRKARDSGRRRHRPRRLRPCSEE